MLEKQLWEPAGLTQRVPATAVGQMAASTAAQQTISVRLNRIGCMEALLRYRMNPKLPANRGRKGRSARSQARSGISFLTLKNGSHCPPDRKSTRLNSSHLGI